MSGARKRMINRFLSRPYTGLGGLSSPWVEEVIPTGLANPIWLAWHKRRALDFGWGNEPNQEWLELLSGQKVKTGWSTAYAGHQFGSWAGRLGDGRAVFLGEQMNANGQWHEVQLKGAGITPFSRQGDGRAVLRSSIREYLASIAMEGLGIPTTSVLALVGSDELVLREEAETAAIVARVAPSFIRFGHFEYMASEHQKSALDGLVRGVLEQHWPDRVGTEKPAVALLSEVIPRTAALIAQWQSVGFSHGVMNTDNFSILGLTIDYGPFNFMDRFRLDHNGNHSDTAGRYTYDQQPAAAEWSCVALTQALWPLIADEKLANYLIEQFIVTYKATHLRLFRGKLGLMQTHEDDGDLIFRLLVWLHQERIDFTGFFRALSEWSGTDFQAHAGQTIVFSDAGLGPGWLQRYQQRLLWEGSDEKQRHTLMRSVNPVLVLRNHWAQYVIDEAKKNNLLPLHEASRLLQNPYEWPQDFDSRWLELPSADSPVIQVSCSS